MSALPCPFCENRHPPRFLCDPAKAVLDALLARGMSFNLPNVEFPAPIPSDQLGLDGMAAGDALARQIVVYAAVLPAAGIIRPAVIFTGQRSDGTVLPRWLYAGRDEDMANLVGLVKDMTELAVRSAAKARGQ